MGKKRKRFIQKVVQKQQSEQEVSRLAKQVEEIPTEITPAEKPALFTDLPLSQASLKGLKKCNYINLTEIQQEAIPIALKNRDILGAAKTGSGKTLAFLVPLLEKLYREQVSEYDGLVALILSPTRELAQQIFFDLSSVGSFHNFSAGLLVGGRKDISDEQKLAATRNILVATPGRLLDHMDRTPNFDCSNLMMLILDEADRILDMGFQPVLRAILLNIPKNRQTMLFSATQNKQVSHLADLSLKNPEFISVHQQAPTATPTKLRQAYSVCTESEKINIIWHFIKSHLKSKIIIFFSTCKQVQFINKIFSKLQPGIVLRCLSGRMGQKARNLAYNDFQQRKQVVLFCTDIAARGLDFEGVDWVVQADCPENPQEYLHRVGRTARFNADGKALLLILPSEVKIIEQLKSFKIPIQQKQIDRKNIEEKPVTPALEALLTQHLDLRQMAEAVVKHYVKATALQPNKTVFNVQEIKIEQLAYSLGLQSVPKISWGNKNQAQVEFSSQQINSENQSQKKSIFEDEEEESDDEFLQFVDKKQSDQYGNISNQKFIADLPDQNNDDDQNNEEIQQPLKKKRKKQKIEINTGTCSKTVFTDEGDAKKPFELLAENVPEKINPNSEVALTRFEKIKQKMKLQDKQDKQSYKQKRRQAKIEKILKKKQKEEQNIEEIERGVVLGAPDEEEESQSEEVSELSQQGSDLEEEVAHLGMGRKNKNKNNNNNNNNKQTVDKKPKLGDLSVAEQEKLALQLLMQ